MGKLRLKPAIKGSTLSPIAKIIDNIDRKPSAFSEGPYARTGTYANRIRNKPGQRIPKAGVYAEAGVGGASAECSILEATARGPYASVGAEASLEGVAAIAKAELVNLSASVGPITAKAGIGIDTGISIGLSNFQVSLLGTGIKFGRYAEVSLFVTSLSLRL